MFCCFAEMEMGHRGRSNSWTDFTFPSLISVILPHEQDCHVHGNFLRHQAVHDGIEVFVLSHRTINQRRHPHSISVWIPTLLGCFYYHLSWWTAIFCWHYRMDSHEGLPKIIAIIHISCNSNGFWQREFLIFFDNRTVHIQLLHIGLRSARQTQW